MVDKFLEECANMANFDHPNVMKLIGVCMDSGTYPFLVVPFMTNGNLLNHLKNRRNELVLPLNHQLDENVVI